jgi:hypothetical protein
VTVGAWSDPVTVDTSPAGNTTQLWSDPVTVDLTPTTIQVTPPWSDPVTVNTVPTCEVWLVTAGGLVPAEMHALG